MFLAKYEDFLGILHLSSYELLNVLEIKEKQFLLLEPWVKEQVSLCGVVQALQSYVLALSCPVYNLLVIN